MHITGRVPPSSPVFQNGSLASPPAPPLSQYFHALFSTLGPQHWWPARTPFEMIVGSILIQSTAWTNARIAIENLRRANLLTPRAMLAVPFSKLARLVRPSGYLRQKAKKLKAFAHFLRDRHHGSLRRMLRVPADELREQLLAVHGIGPETADSILLYAARQPAFVVDAYTRRILSRHGWVRENASYNQMRDLFHRLLPPDVALYNEFHALLVQVGKNWCRLQEARCSACPLGPFLEEGR
jgi:endonuclease III related protein